HVGVIGEEAVDELACRVGVEQRGADQPEIDRREDARVDERFLDDGQREAAGVGEPVAQRDRDEDPYAPGAVEAVDRGAVLDHGPVGARGEPCRQLAEYGPLAFSGELKVLSLASDYSNK